MKTIVITAITVGAFVVGVFGLLFGVGAYEQLEYEKALAEYNAENQRIEAIQQKKDAAYYKIEYAKCQEQYFGQLEKLQDCIDNANRPRDINDLIAKVNRDMKLCGQSPC